MKVKNVSLKNAQKIARALYGAPAVFTREIFSRDGYSLRGYIPGASRGVIWRPGKDSGELIVLPRRRVRRD